jgi:hypothetical protein
MDPIWCFPLVNEPTTKASGANDWVDPFDTNLQMGQLNDGNMGYRVFNGVEGGHTQYFVNNNHWMVDSAGQGNFGSLLSPNRSFQWENGKLVVEGDVAAAVPEYGTNLQAFPEIDVSLAAAPTGKTTDHLYGYGAFGGAWTVGCRLQPDRHITCALEADQPISPGGIVPNRVWEMSFFQIVGLGSNMGGGPFGTGATYFRQCQSNQMDMFCRDRFRMELTKTSVTLYVNGYKYFQQVASPTQQIPGLPVGQLLPNNFSTNPNYVYYSDWYDSPTAASYRIHWGQVSVNPHNAQGNLLAPSSSPSFCLGMPQNTCSMSGGMNGTPTSMPMASPTPTSMVMASPTPTPKSTASPTAVIGTPTKTAIPPTEIPTNTPTTPSPTATKTVAPPSPTPVKTVPSLSPTPTRIPRA